MKKCRNNNIGQTYKRLAKEKQRAFTLIELLLALALFGIVSTSLYMSLRSGLLLYNRTEEGLQTQHALSRLFYDMDRQLRNALYSPQYVFDGDQKKISFLTVKEVYEEDSRSITLAYMSYEFASKRLMFSELMLPEEKETKEVLLEDIIRGGTFYYAYKDEDGSIEWREKWEEESLPYAIKCRYLVRFNEVDKKDKNLEYIFVIPHGIWGEVDS